MPRLGQQRINFLRVGKSWLSYGLLAVAIVGWFALLGLWYGVGALRLAILHHRIGTLQTEVAQLNAEKDQKLSMVQGKSGAEIHPNAKKELSSIFAQPPHWSETVTRLAQLVPHAVVLDEIKVNRDVATNTSTFTLRGTARNEQLIAHFVLNLEGSSLFHNIDLGKTELSTKNPTVVEFEITGKVILRGT